MLHLEIKGGAGIIITYGMIKIDYTEILEQHLETSAMKLTVGHKCVFQLDNHYIYTHI